MEESIYGNTENTVGQTQLDELREGSAEVIRCRIIHEVPSPSRLVLAHRRKVLEMHEENRKVKVEK
jgi:hypothetical protein